jgi:outer membrane receptor for monomeric catechols
MSARMLRTIVVVAFCCSDGAFAMASAQPRHGSGLKQNAARTPAAERTRAADRNSHNDRAVPYKANRLSSPRAAEPILNIPGQTTVLTRQVLDDKNATSVRDAMRSTAGVTVGR